MEKILVYTDGGARGNPGPAAVGVVINIQSSHLQEIAAFGKTIGFATNNVAEYKAVVVALEWLLQNKNKYPQHININFFLDSALVVNQLNGVFKIKEPALIELLFSIKELQQKFAAEITYNLIPRTKNKKADYWVNLALDKNRY